MTRRLLVSYLTLAVLVLLALEIPLGLLYARGATTRFLADVERDAVVLAERAEEAIEEGEAGEVPDMLAEYTRDTGGRALVVDAAGIVLADSGDAAAIGRNLRADADIAAALHHRRRAGQRGTGAGSELSVTVPAASGQKIRGVLRISYPASWVTSQTRQVWWVLAGAGLAVLAIAGGVAAALARWMTRPVRQLQQATAQLASGTLASPPPTPPTS